MNTGNKYEGVVLGENVTQFAKAKSGKGTAVISVRLSTDDISRLETVGRASGKTVSQVVRDAIAAYEVRNHHLVVHVWSGSEMGTGDVRLRTRSASPDMISSLGGNSPDWEIAESSSGTVVAMRPVTSGASPA